MIEIKLNRLSLRDFQGGTVTLDARGIDTFIYAANAGGKTRLVSAFSWLLHNKDALGRSDFSIKNLDAAGEPAHGLEHSVEAEIFVAGTPVVLRKVMREKWVKKRGQAEREFSGHEVQYFVDGVPVKEKEFIDRVANLTGGEDRFRPLTSPTAFPALHWTKQRALLLDICGDVSDADVIDSDARLAPLPAILGRYKMADYRKIAQARRAIINKEMETIPVRIDEVRRSLPDVAGVDRVAAEADVVSLEASLNDAKLRLQGVDTGGQIAALTKKLAGLKADLWGMENKHSAGMRETVSTLNQTVSDLEGKIRRARERVEEIDASISQKGRALDRVEDTLGQLRQRWSTVDGDEFRDTTEQVCAACGQALPADKVQAAREKALAEFNRHKADVLGDIERRGAEAKAEKDRLIASVEALESEKLKINAGLPGEETRLEEATRDRNALNAAASDLSGIPGRADLLSEIGALEVQIAEERAGTATVSGIAKEEIAGIEDQLRQAKAVVDRFVSREKGEARHKELLVEEKKLAAEFETLEGHLFLCDLFTKVKVSMLTDRINAKFETVRFKLFNILINGGVEECCEITVNGVPFNSGLNNAARIQAGCDIIRTLQAHYGMKAPVFCDNRESVTDLPDMGCQVISLVVSPDDKVMRIETMAQRMAA